MKRLITFAKIFFNRPLQTLALAGLIGVMAGFMVVHQPAYAADARPTSTSTVDKVLTEEPRDQAYEEAVEIIDDPNGVQKTYEENLKQYRQENPDQGGLMEEAKDLVKKITPGDR
jgi:hypothetical protein